MLLRVFPDRLMTERSLRTVLTTNADILLNVLSFTLMVDASLVKTFVETALMLLKLRADTLIFCWSEVIRDTDNVATLLRTLFETLMSCLELVRLSVDTVFTFDNVFPDMLMLDKSLVIVLTESVATLLKLLPDMLIFPFPACVVIVFTDIGEIMLMRVLRADNVLIDKLSICTVPDDDNGEFKTMLTLQRVELLKSITRSIAEELITFACTVFAKSVCTLLKFLEDTSILLLPLVIFVTDNVATLLRVFPEILMD